ncbi:glycosyltransferase family 4 protein [Aurantimonas sp. C2-6-R+9]|uniref:glycosyltransferase family 4 protein n=1 Tax=unclassified Aurantimonas TaxID=2638230 RepID=UPI002E18272D|nr:MULTISPECIES: glycosyltransferase family 4 protein [unclassified Aurantimonas]MEC5289677.1 glycosyltransferase family 4 protein [Aurantimonas sp. C2-3-R2]MEC5322242.1 glycosyltransferase family 4 protein [Aurantimonas sp. A3-2-R12]MEC5379643.1 glycosyltransferase family 4 protein [Aurantimonas sp. C2-6-R+9]MEC5410886.1 glycosyltransferase family 4 protein [Aurantimonas sp. C2-4-R8]
MRIAFYAPMKSPRDSHPSGDRTVARGLVEALRLAGHDVVVPSNFRSYDRGDPVRQARIERIGRRIGDRIIRRNDGRAPIDLWFTYHLYHKAPDWLGPRVVAALGIPYAVAEASVADKRKGGTWHRGYEASLAALARADLVVGLNPADRPCVVPRMRPEARYLDLAPFLDVRPYAEAAANRKAARARLAARHGLAGDRPWLLTVAMMREDQKLASYRLLAKALQVLGDTAMQLIVVGAGPAEDQVREAFAGLGSRVAFHGAADAAEMPALYAAADLYVWPAIKESWSMAFLEAQAAGVPVVAGRSGGVPSVVEDGVTGFIVPEGDAPAFADGVRRLLDPAVRERMGRAARKRTLDRHDLVVASKALDGALGDTLARSRSVPQREMM